MLSSPVRISIKRVVSNDITMEEESKRPSVFDRLGESTTRTSMFERLGPLNKKKSNKNRRSYQARQWALQIILQSKMRMMSHIKMKVDKEFEDISRCYHICINYNNLQ